MHGNEVPGSPVRALLALLLLTPLALSCGTDPEIPAIAGEWQATDIDGERWELEIAEDPSGTLTGTYTVRISGSVTLRDAVSGSYDYPAVSWALTVDFPGESPWRCYFRGTMAQSGETFAGTMTCSSPREGFPARPGRSRPGRRHR